MVHCQTMIGMKLDLLYLQLVGVWGEKTVGKIIIMQVEYEDGSVTEWLVLDIQSRRFIQKAKNESSNCKSKSVNYNCLRHTSHLTTTKMRQKQQPRTKSDVE